MPVSGTRLVDANVWLALAFSDHTHHHVAVSWFEGLGEEEATFCRIRKRYERQGILAETQASGSGVPGCR